MMRSLYSGVSGLKNHQTRMDVIGNNIANVNTTGFKGSRVTFQDMLSQSVSGAASPQGNRGGTNPQQIGLGMGIASIDTIFTNGSPQTTGKDTDLAIAGNGFFILSDGDKEYYTRNGAFDFDAEGNFILPGSGLKVKGWMGDSQGNVSTSGQIENIVVPTGQTMPSKVTTGISANGNLSAESKAPTTETKTGIKTAPGANRPVAGTKTTDENGVVTEILTNGVSLGSYYTMRIDVGTGVNAAAIPQAGDNIYNAAGNIIGVVTKADATGFEYLTNNLEPAAPTVLGGVCYLDNTGAPKSYLTGTGAAMNQVSAKEVFSYDAKIDTPGDKKNMSFTAFDSQGIKHVVQGVLEKTSTNTWEFTPKTLADSGAVVTGTPIRVSFDASGKCIDGSGNLMITPTDPPLGSNQLTLKVDFTGLTQYAGTSNVNTEGDGYAAGTLSSVALDGSGMVVGSFSNGMKRNLAQVALATFNNPGGLTKNGSSLYEQSNNSGTVKISTANSGGAGSLTPGNIEMSNVNLSEQFSDMIVTQRGFQSNSKIITVSDEMIETMVNMKR